jgi:acyl-CoA thioesterase II
MTDYPVLAALTLTPDGEHRWMADSVPSAERGVVFGGQLLGQMIIAAKAVDPTKDVRTVHAIFARAGRVGEPLTVIAEPIHSGRTMASTYIKVDQGPRTISGGLVLLDTTEPDVFTQSQPMPDVPGAETLKPGGAMTTLGGEVRIVGDVDLMSAEATGPAELDVWVRWDDPGTDDVSVNQAIAAWFTDPFLISAAMRPHEGLSLGTAHATISTGVINHTLTFHEPFRVDDWMLLSQRTVQAGGGRTYGEGYLFTKDGRHVASFSQENMIRYFPEGAQGDRATSM